MQTTRDRVLTLLLAAGLLASPLLAHADAGSTASPAGVGNLFDSITCALSVALASSPGTVLLAATICARLFVKTMTP